MIKTVKAKKKFRLDELIRFVRENHIGGEHYKEYFSDCNVYLLRINGYKLDYLLKDETMGFQNGKYPNMPLDTTFTVEVEEEITEDTVFQTLVAADSEGDACMMNKGTINEIQDSITTEIYANINGKLQLIWEAE